MTLPPRLLFIPYLGEPFDMASFWVMSDAQETLSYRRLAAMISTAKG